jgi:GT2 family glycosyltransferase
MRVAVVITNYETWDLTARCVAALVPFRAQLSDCVVVDDHSSGPPVALPDWVRVLRNSENLGLVRSLNRGVRAANADIAVLFDSDAHPLHDFIPAIRQLFSGAERLGIVGFRTVDEHGRETGSHEPEPEVASLALGQRLHQLLAPTNQSSGGLCVFTCAMAVRKAAFEELGGFDERFDWLDLDLDFCMRARRAGWGVEHFPELVAFHRGSGAPQRTRERVLRFYRNRWLLLTKFGKIRHPLLVRSLIGLRLAIELLLLVAVGRLVLRAPGEWSDKTAGRVAILKWCLRGP